MTQTHTRKHVTHTHTHTHTQGNTHKRTHTDRARSDVNAGVKGRKKARMRDTEKAGGEIVVGNKNLRNKQQGETIFDHQTGPRRNRLKRTASLLPSINFTLPCHTLSFSYMLNSLFGLLDSHNKSVRSNLQNILSNPHIKTESKSYFHLFLMG